MSCYWLEEEAFDKWMFSHSSISSVALLRQKHFCCKRANNKEIISFWYSADNNSNTKKHISGKRLQKIIKTVTQKIELGRMWQYYCRIYINLMRRINKKQVKDRDVRKYMKNYWGFYGKLGYKFTKDSLIGLPRLRGCTQ